jgi:hypothetical protein
MWEYSPFIFFHLQYSSRDKIYEIHLHYPFSVLHLQTLFLYKISPTFQYTWQLLNGVVLEITRG